MHLGSYPLVCPTPLSRPGRLIVVAVATLVLWALTGFGERAYAAPAPRSEAAEPPASVLNPGPGKRVELIYRGLKGLLPARIEIPNPETVEDIYLEVVYEGKLPAHNLHAAMKARVDGRREVQLEPRLISGAWGAQGAGSFSAMVGKTERVNLSFEVEEGSAQSALLYVVRNDGAPGSYQAGAHAGFFGYGVNETFSVPLPAGDDRAKDVVVTVPLNSVSADGTHLDFVVEAGDVQRAFRREWRPNFSFDNQCCVDTVQARLQGVTDARAVEVTIISPETRPATGQSFLVAGIVQADVRPQCRPLDLELPASVCTDNTVRFAAAAPSAGYRAVWDFGQGASPRTFEGFGEVYVMFDSPGARDVTIEVTGPDCKSVETHAVQVEACNTSTCALEGARVIQHPANGNADGVVELDMCVACGSTPPYRIFYTRGGELVESKPVDDRRPKLRNLAPGTYRDIYVVDANGCKTNVTGPVTLCNGGCGKVATCPDLSCTLTGFNERGTRRAFWLLGLGLDDARWRIADDGYADFVVTGERTARITARIVSVAEPDKGLRVDIGLRARSNWQQWSALGRDWKGSRERIDAGQHETWDYYELDAATSSMEGFGAWSGTLRLSPRPADFHYGVQVGEGANDQNLSPGISAWFAYSGSLGGRNVRGEGDINVEGTCRLTDLQTYTPPIITCAPDWSVGCDADLANAPRPTINCPDADAYTLSYEDERIDRRPVTIERTWTARGPGGPTTCVQRLVFSDDEAPVFTQTPEDATVSCGEMRDMTVEVDDACGEVTVELQESRSDEQCAGSYDLHRVWTATDENGNTATYKAILKIRDQTPPVFGAPPRDLVLECGEDVPTDYPSVVDDCGGVVDTEYSITDCEPGVPVYTWTARGLEYVVEGPDPLLSYPAGMREVELSAECSDRPAERRRWRIYNPNAFPVYLDAVASAGAVAYRGLTIPAGAEVFAFTPGTGGAEIIWRDAGGNERSASAEASAEACDLSDAETCTCIVTRTWTATDDCGNVATHNQKIYFRDTGAPVVRGLPADLTYRSPSEVPAPASVTAEDACDNAVVTLKEYQIPSAEYGCDEAAAHFLYGAYEASGPLLRLNGRPFIIGAEPLLVRELCEGRATIRGEVIDAARPTNRFAVELELAGGRGLEEHRGMGGATPEACPSADKSAWRFYTIASGSRLIGRGALAGTELSVSSLGSEAVQIGPGANNANCRRGLYGRLGFTTAAGSYAGAEGTLQASAATVEFDAAEDCAASYTLVRLYTAVDGCGNRAVERQVLRVHDAAGPVFDRVPDDLQLSCADGVPQSQPEVSDLNDAKVDLELTEESVGEDCDRTITRVWTATDDCGNTATASQVITVRDETGPVITFADPSLAGLASGDVLVVSCAEVPTINEASASATDDCDDAPSLTFTDEPLGAGDCAVDGYQERFRCTWTATDRCGNESKFFVYVEFRDEAAPVFAEVPGPLTQSCAEAFPTSVPTVRDDCDTEVSLTETTRQLAGDCADSYQVVRLWTATDGCGNAATASQVVTVTDLAPPTLSALPQNQTVTCAEGLPTDLPVAADDCDAEVRLLETTETREGNCPGTYELVRLFTATDNCGNVATASQVVTVVDESAPTLTLTPAMLAGRANGAALTLGCADAPSFSAADAVATDACDARVAVSYLEGDLREGDCARDGFARAFTATWTATDHCGNATSISLAVTITDDQGPAIVNVPAAVSVGCDQLLPTDQPTVTDDCSGDEAVVVTETSTTRPGDCAGNYEVVRLWTATDACGNVTTADQVVTVSDEVRPVLAAVPESITLDCSAELPTAVPTASDNCDDGVQVTYADTEQSGACADAVSIVRTFTATDACGNAATATQVITIRDLTPPVFAGVPEPVNLGCADEVPTTQPTVSDLCDGEVELVESTQRRAGACPDGYQLVRTWTATDACGNVATASQVVTIADDTAPVLADVPPATTIGCGEAPPAGRPLATDDCDADVAIAETQETRPGACANTYELVRLFTATDNCGNVATATQVVTVVDDVAPLIQGTPANVTIACGGPLPTEQPSAVDGCDGQVALSETQTTEAGACANGYVIVRLFTATDGCGNVATASQVVTVEDRIAPTFRYVPGDIALGCADALPTEPATARDNCDKAPTVTERQERRDGDCPGTYELVRVFTATDACGNAATASQVITYSDRQAPLLSDVPMDVRIDCADEAPTSAPTVTDDCDEAPTVVLTEERLDGTCAASYRIARRWTATDHCGNVATATQMVTVQDLGAPVFAGVPADLTLACSQALPTEVPVASDACDAEVQITERQRTEPGACPNGYRLVREWTAADDCGNTAVARQVITIEDREAPEFRGVPAAVALSCEEPLPSVGPQVSDNCDDEVAINETQEVRPGSCENSYEVVRTWTATDACGNAATTSQVVTVTDEAGPAFAFVPAAKTIGCDANLPTDQPEVTDACDPAVGLTETQDRRDGLCPGTYSVIRTWTATDACGNVATATQLVSVEDREPPVLTAVPAATVIGCDEALPTTLPVAVDACDPAATLTESTREEAGDCPGSYTVVRTFTATDACGNVATAEQRVAVEDLEAPTFTEVPASLTLACDENLPTSAATATDNCTEAVVVTVTQDSSLGTCAGSFAVVRTFTATDACGNTATASQTVTFRDDVAPAFANIPGAVSIACGDALPSDVPSATDACDADVALVETQQTVPGDCPASYRVVRLWTATDDCGNTATASQTVSVSDREAPTFASVPATVTVECGDELPADLASAADNCDEQPVVSVSERTVPGDCAGAYKVVRLFTATDACGNTATAEQTVNVVDTRAPQFTDVPLATAVACDGDIPTTLAEATDACAAGVVVTEDTRVEPGACAGAYTLVRVFTATDACGNSATAEQRISVSDEKAPEFVSVPEDVTLANGADLPGGAAVATDNCDAQVTLTEETIETPGACPGERTVLRRWTAADDCGNTATAEQRVSFVDDEAPTLVAVPAAVTIGCDVELPTDLPVARDAGRGAVSVVATETTEPGDCPGSYAVTRLFTATDACGNSATASQLVTVRDTVAPRLGEVPAGLTIACDESLPQNAPIATDGCGGQVDLTERQDIEPGLCGGSYRVIRTWTATDACGNTATASQVVRVQDVTAPVLQDVPAEVEIACGQALPSELPTATDACDADVHVAENQQRMPGGCADSYTLLRVFTATDACGNASTATQRVVVRDGAAPVLAGVPVDVTVACHEPLPSDQPTATDDCDAEVEISESQVIAAGDCPGNYTLVRTWTATDDCGNLSTASQTVTVVDREAPAFADVPADVRLPWGTSLPTDEPRAVDSCDVNVAIVSSQERLPGSCANAYVIVRRWTATDVCGNATTASQRVEFVDEEPPLLQSVPADVVIDCEGEFPTTAPTASDAAGGEVSLSERTDRERGACPDAYSVTRIWTATDACGNTATATQLVTVEDSQAPTFAGVPAPLTIGCGDPVPDAAPSVTDNCDDQLRIRESEERIDGLCGESYQIVRTWSAEDDCGNRATASQVITVIDPVAPTFASVPPAVTVRCGDDLPTSAPRGSDNCDDDVELVERQETLPGDCADSYVVVRTWTLSDDCGNTATASQLVTVVDDTPPVLTKVPASRTVACGSELADESPRATDDCAGEVTIDLSETRTGADCASGVEVVRIWTATDNCGNTATASQRIRFEDREAPTFQPFERVLRVACDQPIPVIFPVAGDGCDREVELDYFDTERPGACGVDILRTWVASDDCGNTRSETQTIIVVDDVAPVLAGVPASVTIGCEDPIPPADVTASDNCSATVDVEYRESERAGRCPGERTVIRQWIAVDACGNESVGLQEVKVISSGADDLRDVPADVVLACGDAVPTDLPTAQARCGQEAAEITVDERTEPGNCAGAYRVVRTFSATDACGNVATASQVVTFVDDTPPVIAEVPADAMIWCKEGLPGAAPVATDDCDQDVRLELTERTVAGACDDSYDVIRTWTATDACGNATTASQTVSVVDKDAPVFNDVPEDLELVCGQPIPEPVARAYDGCTAESALVISLDEVTEEPSAAGDYRIVRTWTAADACGNAATARQVITVSATGEPVFTFVPDDLELDCSETVPDAQANAVGGCDGEATLTLAEERERGDCANAYTLVRTWTARTSNGNTATARQRIVVADREAPVFVSVPADVTLTCGASVPTEVAVAEDGCEGRVTVTVDEEERPGACANGRDVVRTFTATDACGNRATATQIVRFGDDEPPVFTSVPASEEYACLVGKPTEQARATDNCTANVRVTHADVSPSADCSERLQRIWTATDDCGNTATAVQQILLRDTERPVISNVPRDASVDLGEGEQVPEPARVQVRDNCGAEPQLDFEERSEPTVNCDYVVVRTWTATDACGNSARATQRITVSNADALGIRVETPTDCAPEGVRVGVTPANRGAQFRWTASGGSFDDATSASPIYYPERPGTHTLTVAAVGGGCSGGASEELELAGPFLRVAGGGEVCRAETVRLTASPDAASYRWDGPGGFSSTEREVVIEEVTDESAGTYELVATYAGGCESTRRVVVSLGDCGPQPDQCQAEVSDIRAVAPEVCLTDGSATVAASVVTIPMVPNGYAVRYLLSDASTRSILEESTTPSFDVNAAGEYGVHQFVYRSADWVDVELPGLTLVELAGRLGRPESCAALTPYGARVAVSADCSQPGRDTTDTGGGQSGRRITIRRELGVSFTDTLCVAGLGLEISGSPTTIEDLCADDRRGRVATRLGADGCILYTGLVPGTDSLCLRVCAQDACDTFDLRVNVLPTTPSTIDIDLRVGELGTYCLDDAQLAAPLTEVFNFCVASGGEAARAVVDETSNCVDYEALAEGEAQACLVLCNAIACDTTYVNFFVTEGDDGGEERPAAFDDRAATTKGMPVDIDVVANDLVRGSLAAMNPVEQPRQGRLIEISETIIRYAPREEFCAAVDSFTYLISNGRFADTASVYVEVSCDDVVIFSGFSPNGDGVNDYFAILGIENYPDNEVLVFNRWGNEVYHREGYVNSRDLGFAGKWDGKQLPSGTYFYVVDLGNGDKRSGYVQIMR